MNAKRVQGPYGGGNQFATNLERYLQSVGHDVYRSLAPDLDLILIVSSKRHHQTTSYDIGAIREYVALNPNVVVVQRVNSSDEPRGQDLGINQAMLRANEIADYTVFISSFVRDLFAGKGMDLGKPNSVIFNGADAEVFNPVGRAEWRPGEKLRVVTHHWSANYMKGFDVYERLDQLLAVEPFKDLFEFACVGNVPLGVTFKHARVVGPTAGTALADVIRQHHVYLTAARNEAAGMHHIEGMLCGLPVLFLNSGALPEYCSPFGIEFNLADFEQRLLEMRERYLDLWEKVLECPYTGAWMAAQYESVFSQLVAERRQSPLPGPSLGQRLRVQLVDRPQRRIQRLRQLGRRALSYLVGGQDA